LRGAIQTSLHSVIAARSSAKNLLLWAAGRFQQLAKRSKSFLVLFFKKELLFSF